jgi:endonuclease/exonuclease/phosphatase (EEP) superfamily protein YafD
VSFDFWIEHPDPAEAIAFLAKSGADVIGLAEVTPELKDALASLKEQYPYSIDCIGKDPFCELMLLSKKPLRYPFAGKVGAKLTYVASADIDWQGKPVSIAMTHVALPFITPDWAPLLASVPADDPSPLLPGTPVLWQSMQVAVMAEYAKTLGRDRIVMGNFNSTPWSDVQSALRTDAGLENRGPLVPTWPTWVPVPLRIPIDSVFVGGKLALKKMRSGPDVGSDHLPVIAEIVAAP